MIPTRVVLVASPPGNAEPESLGLPVSPEHLDQLHPLYPRHLLQFFHRITGIGRLMGGHWRGRAEAEAPRADPGQWIRGRGPESVR